jgi:hypothetical protein
MMLGQEGLLPHGIKSPSTPLHSPTRGHLFLSDHHSENSNDAAVTSDQEDEDESMRADPRIELAEHRGDPRDDLRAAEEAEDRGTGSPIGPLSLTTNDKDNAETSPKSNILTEVSQQQSYRTTLLFCYFGRFQNYWVLGLCPSSGILENRRHNVSETGPVSETLCLLLSRTPDDEQSPKT